MIDTGNNWRVRKLGGMWVVQRRTWLVWSDVDISQSWAYAVRRADRLARPTRRDYGLVNG